MSESLDRSGETPARRAAEAMTDARLAEITGRLTTRYGWMWLEQCVEDLLVEVQRLRRVSAPQDVPDRSAEAADELREALRGAMELFGRHSGHWDKTGGSGSGCPVCIEQREFWDAHKHLLAAAPPSAQPTPQTPESLPTRSSEALDELRRRAWAVVVANERSVWDRDDEEGLEYLAIMEAQALRGAIEDLRDCLDDAVDLRRRDT